MNRSIRRCLGLPLLTVLSACSSGAQKGTAVELPPACESFVAKYQSCISAAAPSMPDLAKQRADQTRAALEQEAKDATKATTGAPPASLTALASKCDENLKRLSASCGPSRAN